MTTEFFRAYFLGIYAVAITVAVLKAAAGRLKSPGHVERRPEGPARCLLPAVVIPFVWLLPPLVIYLRAGALRVDAFPVRCIGVALSILALFLLAWTSATLGRFLVPRAVVFQDHELVTRGPFRLIRHPTYSGVMTFFLGAALGTLNVFLLLIFPLAALGFFIQARLEEDLLESKFGESYRSYAHRTHRFIPGIF